MLHTVTLVPAGSVAAHDEISAVEVNMEGVTPEEKEKNVYITFSSFFSFQIKATSLE
jgi:hypothetical protein